MASAALRGKQAPIKDGYSITCKIGTGKQISQAKQKIVGLHQKAGDDAPEIFVELCSGEMLLKELVACAGVTLKAVAMTLDIPITEGAV
ncbi:hypothetical protein LTR17_024526 [Elasticomyces elasticus]|nr:hypothetical protein LTR17_024526 [Elasticomyces elasticus]